MRRFRTWNSQLNAFGVVQNAPNLAPGQTISKYCHFVIHNVRNMVKKHNVSYYDEKLLIYCMRILEGKLKRYILEALALATNGSEFSF